jgi:hypothetical protein
VSIFLTGTSRSFCKIPSLISYIVTVYEHLFHTWPYDKRSDAIDGMFNTRTVARAWDYDNRAHSTRLASQQRGRTTSDVMRVACVPLSCPAEGFREAVSMAINKGFFGGGGGGLCHTNGVCKVREVLSLSF